jgi:hypothetical protein
MLLLPSVPTPPGSQADAHRTALCDPGPSNVDRLPPLVICDMRVDPQILDSSTERPTDGDTGGRQGAAGQGEAGHRSGGHGGVGRRKRVRKLPRVETEEGVSGYGEVLFKQVGIVMSDSDSECC